MIEATQDEYIGFMNSELDYTNGFNQLGITETGEIETRKSRINQVLGFFYQKLGVDTVIGKYNPEFKGDFAEMLVGWSSGDMFEFLTQGVENPRPNIIKGERVGFSDDELGIIYANNWGPLEQTMDNMAVRWDQVVNVLSRSSSDISITSGFRDGYFYDSKTVGTAIEQGNLASFNASDRRIDKRVVDAKGDYVDPKLTEKVNLLYAELDKPENQDLKEIFIISSGTRDFITQIILKKLGYPAAGLSYHNFGQAVDFRTNNIGEGESPSFYDQLQMHLTETRTDGRIRGEVLKEMMQGGKFPSISEMVAADIISNEHAIARFNRVLASIPGTELLDETAFFYDNIATTEGLPPIRPVFHLQLAA